MQDVLTSCDKPVTFLSSVPFGSGEAGSGELDCHLLKAERSLKAEPSLLADRVCLDLCVTSRADDVKGAVPVSHLSVIWWPSFRCCVASRSKAFLSAGISLSKSPVVVKRLL